MSIFIYDFVDAAQSLPIIDVRSPSEFRQGHIPGAYNLPLFDDEERAKIGTIYKQQGRDAAFKHGLEIVGPKMKLFVEEAEKIAPQRRLLLHCWRGGMRSRSFGWLLETAGFNVQTVEKGYKAFRNFVLDQFAEEQNIHILSGYTGSGKTDILYALREMGEQVIDLEGLAHHKGSAFGYLGEKSQPTGEQFQNELGMTLYRLNENQPIWLEDESRFIGRRQIPHQLFNQMQSAHVFQVKVSKKDRIECLVQEYGSYPIKELEKSLLKIKKRLGGLRTQQAIEALHNREFERVTELVLHYYDKAYARQLGKRDAGKIRTLSVDAKDPRAIARILVEETTSQTV
jgi:tRNA 2-selenouridine synthase